MGPGIPGLWSRLQQGIQHPQTPGGLARARALTAAPAVIRSGVAGPCTPRGSGIHAAESGQERDRVCPNGRRVKLLFLVRLSLFGRGTPLIATPSVCDL